MFKRSGYRHEKYRAILLYWRSHSPVAGKQRVDTTGARQAAGEKTSTISAYETNAKLPSAECLIEMAELFGISLDTLIYGENAELLSVRSLSQEQKGLVSALAEYFGTEPTRQKSIELRWFLITELIRLLNQ